MSPKQHIMNVKALGCVICRKIGLDTTDVSEAHHVFDSAARSDWLVIPLCAEHHRGQRDFMDLDSESFSGDIKPVKPSFLQ